jgi:hypothetical protein
MKRKQAAALVTLLFGMLVCIVRYENTLMFSLGLFFFLLGSGLFVKRGSEE